MDRIRIGVIGAGAIAQIEHIPNLLRLSDRFTVAGVSDPSRTSRQFVSEQFGLPVFSESGELLGLPLEAVLIASPDPLHFEHVMAAFDRKLHVFCEKPLCYSPGEIDIVIAARDAVRRCLQVGYMKRFDPSYVTALEEMPGKADRLRYVSVEVDDPDAWPFVRHHPHRRGQDIASELVEETLEKQRAQVARAVNASLDAQAFRGFVNAYCSSLVHDVNAVHGHPRRPGGARRPGRGRPAVRKRRRRAGHRPAAWRTGRVEHGAPDRAVAGRLSREDLALLR